MIKNIFIFLFLIFLLTSLASAPKIQGVQTIFFEENNTVIISKNNVDLISVHLVDKKIDLTTMVEIFEIIPKITYTVKSSNFTNRFVKLNGSDIESASWYFLNKTDITTVVDDYGFVNRSTNGTEWYNSWEIVGNHTENQTIETWIPLPTSFTVIKNKIYYVKLVYTKKAETGNVRIQTIPSFFETEVPQFTWWNTSWAYRIDNNISNDTRPYQLSLNISNSTGTNNNTHVFCNGQCNTNFTDIRFTLNNETDLPHWIEDNVTGKIWVNVTSNGTVNMYYGNAGAIYTSNGKNTFKMFLDFENTVEGYSTGSSSTTQKKFGFYSFAIGSGSIKTVTSLVSDSYSLIKWYYPTSTSTDGTLQFRHNSSGYAYLGKGYVFPGYWVYYEGAWKNTTRIITPNQWIKVEMLFRPANYDILFNDVVYKTGILYNSGNIQYEISSSTLFTDAQLIRTYATPEFGWETWSSVNIQEVVSCIWCKNVNVTVYNNGSAKTYSPAGTVEGNLSLRFFNDVGTNDSITYNLTVDNSTYKAFNHSSNNWSTRVTFILSNVTNSTNFSIQRYNITNYKIADQWILSNSTGFIVYNATLFNGSEYTIITTTTPGASVLVLVGVATIIIGGTVYYLRRVRKL